MYFGWEIIFIIPVLTSSIFIQSLLLISLLIAVAIYHKTINLTQEVIKHLKQTYSGSKLNLDQNKRILQQKYLPSNTMVKSSGFSMIKRGFDKPFLMEKLILSQPSKKVFR